MKQLGIGILKDGITLSNARRTFITPPGEGFVRFQSAY